MSIDRSQFFEIMSRFPSGVTVVTTMYRGKPFGLTVSAFASLSATPTMVLVSIESAGLSCEAISETGAYAVNILAEDQAHMSAHFAQRVEEKFTDISYSIGEAGLPLLDDALGYVECRVAAAVQGGDHTVFFGEVIGGGARDGRPLVYFQRGYHRLG